MELASYEMLGIFDDQAPPSNTRHVYVGNHAVLSKQCAFFF